MRLRVSGDDTGREYALDAVMTGEGDVGIGADREFNAFAEAICAFDSQAIESARDALVRAVGQRAMVDAAAVIASFNAYPRMADATGIPLEEGKKVGTESLRSELGLGSFKITD